MCMSAILHIGKQAQSLALKNRAVMEVPFKTSSRLYYSYGRLVLWKCYYLLLLVLWKTSYGSIIIYIFS